MAKIPVYTSRQQVTNQEIGGRISPSVGRQVGTAVSQFGGEIAKWGLAQKKAQEELAVLEAQTEATSMFQALGTELKAAPTDKVPELFEQGSAQIMQGVSGKLSSPYAQRAFSSKFGQLKVTYGQSARTDARDRFIKQGVASIDGVVATLISDIAKIDKEKNGPEYELKLQQIQMAIGGGQRGGFIDAVDAGKRMRKALSDVDEAQARRLIREDPEKAAIALLDAENYPNLNPLAHERLAKLAQGAAESKRAKALALSEKEEKRRDKEIKRDQSLRANDILGMIIDAPKNPEARALIPSDTELRMMEETRQINGSQREMLMKAKEALEEAQTDVVELLDVFSDIDDIPDMRPSEQEAAIEKIEKRVLNLVSSGRLELDDVSKVRSALGKVADKRYKNSPRRRAAKWLQRALGGADQEFRISGFNEDPAEAVRRQNAMREYYDRVEELQEKPWAVAQDLFKRSVRAQDLRLDMYPRPTMAPDKPMKDWTRQDITASQLGTVAAYRSGQMKIGQFRNEMKALTEMGAILELKERFERYQDQGDDEQTTSDDGNADPRTGGNETDLQRRIREAGGG